MQSTFWEQWPAHKKWLLHTLKPFGGALDLKQFSCRLWVFTFMCLYLYSSVCKNGPSHGIRLWLLQFLEGLVSAFRGFLWNCVNVIKSSEVILAWKGCALYSLALYASCHSRHLLSWYFIAPIRGRGSAHRPCWGRSTLRTVWPLSSPWAGWFDWGGALDSSVVMAFFGEKWTRLI